MTPRWLAIVNPRSGGNRNEARLRQTLDALRPVTHRTVVTSYAGHAAELASQSQSYAGVVAVGGDGTLFEILKGIDRQQQRIAILPAGRGNSLARDLGLMRPRSIEELTHWAPARAIDLMEVRLSTQDGAETTYLSASSIALGYPAAVVMRARPMAMLGRISYAAASAGVRPPRMRVRVQYGRAAASDLCLTGFVANNTRHMASFLAFPNASVSDGLFEIMEMRSGFVQQMLHNVSALSHTGFYQPCSVMQAETAHLTLEKPQALLIDGEIFHGVVALAIRMLPQALVCNGRRTG